MTQSYSNRRELSFNQYLTKTFTTVAIGLAISAACAFIASILMPILMMRQPIFSTFLILTMAIAELGIAIYFSSRLLSMPKSSAWLCFVIYAILTGVSFFTIFMYYDLGSVLLAFVATLIMFVCMAIIGRTSRFNYASIYGLLLPAIIAGSIITLLNGFIFHSSFISLLIAYIGLILFLVLTAADMQKLEQFYNQSAYDNELSEKLMIMGALQLYLDFINIFIRILRFVARNKNRD